MIKYILTKLGPAGWENIWLSVNGAQTERSKVRTPLPRAKYFHIRPSHLVNNYIII